MAPPHTGCELSEVVEIFLQDQGIDRKGFSLTLDDATSNDNMQEVLKDRLCARTNGLICGGEFFTSDVVLIF